MLNSFEVNICKLCNMIDDLNKDLNTISLSDRNDKAIRDVVSDMEALADVLWAYSLYKEDKASESLFHKAYNIYRSKRGIIGYED